VREVITIQIIRPNFDDMHPVVKREMIENMAKDIAKQISAQEDLRKMNETIDYWQRRILEWEHEDRLRERKDENLKRT
jgi:hypothetical protein